VAAIVSSILGGAAGVVALRLPRVPVACEEGGLELFLDPTVPWECRPALGREFAPDDWRLVVPVSVVPGREGGWDGASASGRVGVASEEDSLSLLSSSLLPPIGCSPEEREDSARRRIGPGSIGPLSGGSLSYKMI